ncbi:MAG TPA: ABC transporter permease [Candidatus Bathyarchaeia archaeon]|nr:ABC transporter permease [Candidatus Bathyarchaeia archaeon]
MRAIAAVALNTFREAIRDRVLYLILAVALAVVGGSRFVAMLTVGSEVKIVKDLGLAAVSIFGLLIAVFVGVSLVSKEIERRTVFTLLAQPVARWQFIAGKYAGLLLVLAANVVLVGGAVLAAVALMGESPLALVPAIVLILVELSVVAAFSVLFSSFTNPILAAVGTVAVYVAGHLSWSFDLLRKRVATAAARTLCDVLHAVLPNLDRLDVKADAVHGVAIPAGTFAAAAAYGAFYAIAVVVLACIVFERREFA